MRVRFNERLRELRAERSMTQEQLSDALDIPSSTIRRLESDEDSLPRLDRLEEMANYFNCSIDYLVGRTNDRYQILSDEARYFIDTLELSDEDALKKSTLSVDGIPLSSKQIKKILGWIRVERDTDN